MSYGLHIMLAALGSWALIMGLVTVAGLTLHNAIKEAKQNVKTIE